MAIIQKTKIKFGNIVVERVIKCNSDGLFSIDYPSEVSCSLDKRVEEGATKDDVATEWWKTCDNILQAVVATRKVILYRFEANCKISNHHPDEEKAEDRWENIINRNDFSMGDGLIIGILADVFEETRKTFPDGKSSYEYDRVWDDDLQQWMGIRGTINHGRFRTSMWDLGGQPYKDLIDWTPERQEFFQSFNDNLAALIIKLNDMLSSSDNLLKVVDSGVKLLGNSK